MSEKEEDEEARLIRYVNRMKLATKSRKPHLVEQRFYIIAILHYKYGWTEFRLGALFNRDHSTINHGKVKPYAYIENNDERFILHCKQLFINFPYVFPKPELYVKPDSRKIYLNLNREREAKLLEFKALYPTLRDLNQTMNHLIDKFL